MDGIALAAGALYVIVLLRAGGTFAVGWLAGAGARRGRFAKLTSSERFRRAERAIQRWGAPVVAVSFLTVGFQTAVNFLAGSMRMPLSRYLPALFVGGAAWALIYATAGLGVLEVLGRLFAERTLFGVSAVVVLLLAVCGVVVYRRRRAAPSSGDAAVDGS
ncbi:DedA family protein [Streptomyces anulatus]|uniref:DedA family protein n=1 Tax=Streptomyces anulatus TaxID=1892 RepID=UPI001C273CAC|nr:VTT domain-containing protein [Streptomyces anulatus]